MKLAGNTALSNPVLLAKRGELFQAAHDFVYNNGYRFKKGYSRSKQFTCGKKAKDVCWHTRKQNTKYKGGNG